MRNGKHVRGETKITASSRWHCQSQPHTVRRPPTAPGYGRNSGRRHHEYRSRLAVHQLHSESAGERCPGGDLPLSCRTRLHRQSDDPAQREHRTHSLATHTSYLRPCPVQGLRLRPAQQSAPFPTNSAPAMRTTIPSRCTTTLKHTQPRRHPHSRRLPRRLALRAPCHRPPCPRPPQPSRPPSPRGRKLRPKSLAPQSKTRI